MQPEIEKILELVRHIWRTRVKNKKDIAEIEKLWRIIDKKYENKGITNEHKPVQ
jgi:hypothetical protein